ncbi:hypothetical protein INS49_012312 [Diaporthe citri]|uniref:uncharacterized protein n=1 Tax=Diaporthe citri TaxID=83186 RepID=UPI001C7E7F97|nr:uncharacterized protein INS49_012312 [Diaporthe citri]KAG6358793.1 hypothetical protein INS49_012312 [Diaporthe citri]
MKLSSNIALATMAAQASALVQIEVRYSDTMIEVGNLDLFAVTYQAIYDEDGNQRSVMMDRSYGTFDNTCKSAEEPDPDLNVQVKVNGAWGRTPGLADNEMREGLVAAMWEALQAVTNPSGYEVFSECRGLDWQESVGYTDTAACGPESSRNCEEPCSKEGSPGLAQCMKHSWGHQVPSSMRVTAYIDDQLQADDLIIEFASARTPKDGGCGIIGDIAGTLAGYVIPVAGGLFAKGISIGCSS